MIYHFMPFSLDWDYAAEINKYVQMVPDMEDHICIWDGDTIRLRPKWGTNISDMIKANPEFDLLICMATRIGCHYQRLNNSISNERDLFKLHQMIDKQDRLIDSYKAEEVTDPGSLSGFLMCFKKKTAIEIPFRKSKTGILNVDGNFGSDLQKAGKRVGLVKKICVIHYYRLNKKDRKDKSHLIKPI